MKVNALVVNSGQNRGNKTHVATVFQSEVLPEGALSHLQVKIMDLVVETHLCELNLLLSEGWMSI
jgi:hypothetical protein